MKPNADSLISARVRLQELLKLAVALHLEEQYLRAWLDLCEQAEYSKLEQQLSQRFGSADVVLLYDRASSEVDALVDMYSVNLSRFLSMMQSFAAYQ